jgi:hypothetical protein
MLILLGAVLFTFGLLLFSLGVTVWLVGLALRVAIRLFQLGLLIVWAGFAGYRWLHQRKKVTALEGEILPPLPRALPDRSHVRRLLFAALLTVGFGFAVPAHADSWSDFYAQHGPGLTTIEMRKSWQDRAGEAVHQAEPDTWADRPYWEKGEALRDDWNAPSLTDAPAWLLLDCTSHSNRWRLSPRTHYSWRKVCR